MAFRVKDTTHNEYHLKLHNTILPLLSGDALLKDLEWKNGGRESIMNVLKKIEKGNKYDLAHRRRTLLLSTFDTAISRGWMTKGQNPAERLSNEKSNHGSKHHCTINWDAVPELFRVIRISRCDINQ